MYGTAYGRYWGLSEAFALPVCDIPKFDLKAAGDIHRGAYVMSMTPGETIVRLTACIHLVDPVMGFELESIWPSAMLTPLRFNNWLPFLDSIMLDPDALLPAVQHRRMRGPKNKEEEAIYEKYKAKKRARHVEDVRKFPANYMMRDDKLYEIKLIDEVEDNLWN